MAGKTPGNRKSTSTKQSTQKKGSTATPIESSSTVTPISQSPAQGLTSTHGSASKQNQNSAQSQVSSRVAGPELVERIRVRAYELFELRGRREGFHQEDWAQAEAEVLAIFEREKSA